jgi:xanthine dehydrogenase YagS FAD-binding subunit
VRAVRYERAPDPATAIASAGAGSARTARYLGGGTNLVDLMKLGVESPELLVDVTRAGLDGIVPLDGGGLRIGAGVRNSDLAADLRIRSAYPVLAEALLSGASGQLRNMATVGGNLLQRTRCRYFQDVMAPCNKRRPGSGCPALAGEHHNLAIFGASEHCIATHPSDMAVALTALDASVELQDAGGPRRLPLSDLYRPPGDRPEIDTNLAPGELITAVVLDRPVPGRATYRKVRERASFAFAIASVAAILEVDAGGTVVEARLALGAVAHQPWRARQAEQELVGGPAETTRFATAIDRELQAAKPLPGNAYKVPLIRNLVVAALETLAGGGGREVQL